MKYASPCLVLLSMMLVGPAAVGPTAVGAEPEWTPLFNGENLDGFDVFLGRYTEDQLNNDTANIVTAHDGMVHIYRDTPQGSQVPFGYFSTKQEYSHYHLRFEYKWGKKKFAPRMEVVRDTGVIYHMVGPHVVWPRGVECQVQEGDTGDIFTVMGTQITTTIDPNLKARATPMIKYQSPEKGGVPHTQGSKGVSRVVKSETTELDGWNTVEVIVRGQESFEHIVNGVTNNAGADIRQLAEDEETWLPLGKGKILFQVEGAEVFYRNIEIKVLPESK